MPRLGSEPTITALERAKAVHASDRAATVIGMMAVQGFKFRNRNSSDSINVLRQLLAVFLKPPILHEHKKAYSEYTLYYMTL
jgi:hypothetical protein